MFYENLVMKNIGILERLTKGQSSLEELVQTTKCRKGELSSSLKILEQQGLVQQDQEVYMLKDKQLVSDTLSLIKPWISYFNGSFYDIAKDAVKVIFEKSWESKRITDILLYGSTLTKPNPTDIDLLIIHDGGYKMQCFSPYSTLRVDEPIGEKNARDGAFSMLKQIGYKEGAKANDTVVAAIGKRIEPLCAGTVTDEEIKKEIKYKGWYEETYGCSFDISNRIDIHGINNIFDVNILHQATLLQEDDPRLKGTFWNINEVRQKAIESCKDQTFWYTILSKGKLYDRAKHDFTLNIEDKYPKALSLFPKE